MQLLRREARVHRICLALRAVQIRTGLRRSVMGGRKQIYDGEWVRPRRKTYRHECCDCGLVHKMDFRLVPNGGGKSIEFRVFRDRTATERTRRTRK